MELALLVAFVVHPVGVLAVLGLLAIGMALSTPLNQYGAMTKPSVGILLALAGSLYNTYAAGVVAGTIPVNVLTGAGTCYLNSAATTPGNQTTRTATQLYNDWLLETGLDVLPAGFSWDLSITQTGAGTMTLVGGTGVTITGTATIAQNTTRTFVGQFTGTPTNPTFTITSVSVGSYS
jgi:hypothetical protein